ncbi:MAG: uncharacterized protein KVP18_002048 [Porospora cf. gigantea A]|nr:MAG: hypothetical protein KVP18_002048 [Porospora cf. gigantea A]
MHFQLESALEAAEESANVEYQNVVHTWEDGFDKTWEREDEVETQDLPTLDVAIRRTFPARDGDSSPRRGVVRHLVVVLDATEAAGDTDFKPTRMGCFIGLFEHFIAQFLDVNPVSLVAVVVVKDREAVLLSPLSACGQDKVKPLRAFRDKEKPVGHFSLQNALDRAVGILETVPAYGTREVLFLLSAIKTVDVGLIAETAQKAVDRNVRVSAVSTSPEVYAFKQVCDLTGGSHAVCESVRELTSAMSAHLTPPLWTDGLETRLIAAGFPKLQHMTTVALCMCHDEPLLATYACPRCRALSCQLPTECAGCKLHLVSLKDLSRTGHLYDAPVIFDGTKSKAECAGCGQESAVSLCRGCRRPYCPACDEFIHEELHQCPTCLPLN